MSDLGACFSIIIFSCLGGLKSREIAGGILKHLAIEVLVSCDGNEITERLIDAVPDLWSEQQQAKTTGSSVADLSHYQT